MVIQVNAVLGDLDDVNVGVKVPADQDVLSFDGSLQQWVPKAPAADGGSEGLSAMYVIELSRWNIRDDGEEPQATTQGINDAILWAAAQGIRHVVLPSGTYKLRMHPETLACIVMQSGIHFEMENGCVLELEANSSPWYSIIQLKGIRNAKVSGGVIVGDKKAHMYEIALEFERGGVNADGTLNNDRNYIRTKVIDRYEHPGLLRTFRLWNLPGVTASGYSFYQYKDTVSSASLVGYRTNGQFAPSAPTGRGWFAPIEAANKMIFTIDISKYPLTDNQISRLTGKVDNQSYTHEWGHGIDMTGSNDIEIAGIDISNCTGDAISSGWLQYRLNPEEYTQEEMGNRLFIHDCNLHHCRRQGISITSTNDVWVHRNHIHDIGKADDGVTVDGTSPMFGIDIESMWSESNIPTWRPELDREGLELNTRIHIFENYIYNNARGHFVNADGIQVVVENNLFEGYNVGGISSYQNNWYVKYINNTMIGCELVVKGDNVVHGAVCRNGNVKLQDVRGAVVQNVHIQNGMLYGSSVYGYFGTPSVDVAASRFTYAAPHGMGNGAKVSFEAWTGKLPGGISPDKLYYTVQVTSTGFQVSETLNGSPVPLQNAGQPGFNISRFDYGRCYISDVVIEREWRGDNTLTPNLQLLLTGGVVKNVTVKNYDVSIRTPANYAGRPIVIEGLTVIEGAVNVEGCYMSGSKFMRIKTSRLGGDITLGSNSAAYTRNITAEHCLFQNVGVNFDGNVLCNHSTFYNSTIQKTDNNAKSVIAHGYLENSRIALHWITKPKSVTFVRNVYKDVAIDANANTVMVDNVDIS